MLADEAPLILCRDCGSSDCGLHVEREAKQAADLTWRPAIDLVLRAFEQRPLVAVSDGAGHGQVETRNFLAALIRGVVSHQPSETSSSNSAMLDIKR